MQFLCCFLSPSKYKAYTAAIAVLINSLITSWIAFPALSGQMVELSVFAGIFLGNIIVRIDGLSAWFILIINFTSLTGVFYGIGYLKALFQSCTQTYPPLVAFHPVSSFNGMGMYAAEWFRISACMGSDVAYFDVAGYF